MHRRSRATRVVALATACFFFNVEFVALQSGRLAVPQASAQEGGKKVAFYIYGATALDKPVAPHVQAMMRTKMGALQGVTLVTAVPEPETDVNAEVTPIVNAAFDALQRDLETKKEPDPALAEEKFQEAYDKLIRNTGQFDRRLLARTLKGLAIAKIMEGDRSGGQELITASLNVWPDQTDSEYMFDQLVLGAAKQILDNYGSQQPGSVNVEVEPEGALVFHNGVYKTLAPNFVEDLRPGLNWLVAEAEGYKRQGTFVNVREGEETSHAFALEATDAQAAIEAIGGEIQKAFIKKKKRKKRLQENGTALWETLNKPDEVHMIAVTVKGSDYVFSGYKKLASTPKIKKLTKVKIPADENFDAALLTWMGTHFGGTVGEVEADTTPLDGPKVVGGGDLDIEIDPAGSIIKEDLAAQEDSILGEWWFWTVMGVAAAGLGGGMYVLIAGSDGETGPSGTMTIDLVTP